MSGEGSGSAEGTEKEKDKGEEKKEEEKFLRKQSCWTHEEDAKLLQLVGLHGENWTLICSEIPSRSYNSCRLRWLRRVNLSGDGRRFTAEEDDFIRARQEHGDEWETIAESLPGRNVIAVINRWHSNLCLRKRDGEGTSVSSPSNLQIDFPERKRLCQREEEDVETPDTATVNLAERDPEWMRLLQSDDEDVETPETATVNLAEPDPTTSHSRSLPGSGGDGGGSVKGKEKKE